MIGLKRLEREPFAVLVCAGMAPSKALLEAVFNTVNKTRLYCADGGAGYLKALGLIPEVIVGDLDSVDEAVVNYYAQKGTKILPHPPEKDFSDTELALNYLIEAGEKNILLLGAMGGRLDHYFANLMLMASYGRRGIKLSLMDESNFICYLNKGEYKIEKEGGYLSFFALSDSGMRLSLSGVKYPLKSHLVPFGSSLCLSNEFLADALVHLESGDGVMVLSEERSK